MLDIKNNFKKFGRFFRIYDESPNAYIFAISNDFNGKPIYFEIFEKRPYVPFNADIGDKKIRAPSERWQWAYPSNEAFGRWAYTTTTLEAAIGIRNKIELKKSVNNN